MSWKEFLEDFLVQFPKKYAERRARKEGFVLEKHDFYVHDALSQFIEVLLTGTLIDFYYMDKKEVFEYSLALHKKIADEDKEFYKEAVRLAREVAAIKDQVLIAALVLSKEDPEFVLELLKTFPPNQIVKKFISAKRANNKIIGGLGTREKKILQKLLNEWKKDGRLEYYFVKYRRYVRDIINLSHYKMPKEEFIYLSNPTKYSDIKNQWRSEYLMRISLFLKHKDSTVLPEKTPWNIIRSNLKKNMWKYTIDRADLTGNALVLQAVSLYQAIGDEILKHLDRILKSPTVTADKILKACLVAYTKGYDKLAKKLAEAYARKVVDTYKQLLLPLEKPRILAVLDASGSMEPSRWRGMFFKALTVIAPFAPLIAKLILFDNDAGEEDAELLKTFEGLLKLKEEIARIKYGGGTCIMCALVKAIELAEYYDVVILITDEQANVTSESRSEMRLIKKLLDMGKIVIIINPTPYPVRITDIKDKRIIYIPAMNPETVLVALRLAQIRKTSPNAHELLVKIREAIRKKKKKHRMAVYV